MRIAKSRTSDDQFPIYFRMDCERTYFDPVTGKDESLVEVIERLDKAGYDLIETYEPENKK